MKTCTKCGHTLPMDEFHRQGEGRRPDCRSCHNEAERARPRAHRPSCQPEYKRAERMRRLFGITLEEFDLIYEEQGGACAICREPCSWNRRNKQPLVIDHDHVTGEVRGLLCHYCNGLLGWARDNQHILVSAIEYLARVEVRQEEIAAE